MFWIHSPKAWSESKEPTGDGGNSSRDFCLPKLYFLIVPLRHAFYSDIPSLVFQIQSALRFSSRLKTTVFVSTPIVHTFADTILNDSFVQHNNSGCGVPKLKGPEDIVWTKTVANIPILSSARRYFCTKKEVIVFDVTDVRWTRALIICGWRNARIHFDLPTHWTASYNLR